MKTYKTEVEKPMLVIKYDSSPESPYVNGEVYGFILYDEKGEIVDSCYAFYDIEDIREYLGEEWKNEDLMEGEHCVLDKDGNTTALFIYCIDGEYLLGVNGAGWNFYDGVWDKLYDVLGFKWHDEYTCSDGHRHKGINNDGDYCPDNLPL